MKVTQQVCKIKKGKFTAGYALLKFKIALHAKLWQTKMFINAMLPQYCLSMNTVLRKNNMWNLEVDI